MLANWRIAAQSLTIPELFERIVSDIDYKQYIDDESEEGEDRWDNVLELKRLAEEYSTRTLDDFLENIALVSDQDTLTEGNVPTLLTLHAAKGLEFGVVFLVGLTQLPRVYAASGVSELQSGRYAFFTVAAVAVLAAIVMLGLKPGLPAKASGHRSLRQIAAEIGVGFIGFEFGLPTIFDLINVNVNVIERLIFIY